MPPAEQARFVAEALEGAEPRLKALWHDGSLFKLSTWRSGAKLLFARDGMIRSNYSLWRDDLSPQFHPGQHEAPLSAPWLQDNTAQISVVGQTV